MSKLLSDISLGDLMLLAELPRYPSLRAWASKNRLSPMTASRLIKKLERSLNVQLIARSTVGSTMTFDGERVAKKAALLVAQATELREISGAEHVPFTRSLVFASRGFLNSAIASSLARAVSTHFPDVGLRFVDLSPEETLDATRRNAVDCTLNLEELALGKAWQVKPAGHVTWGIYARKDHPLTFAPHSTELSKYRLGHHAYWNGRQIVTNEGETNPHVMAAITGYGAQNAFTALSICSTTDQIAHVPLIAARLWEDSGLVREISIEGLRRLRIPARLGVDSTRVSAALFKLIRDTVASTLET